MILHQKFNDMFLSSLVNEMINIWYKEDIFES